MCLWQEKAHTIILVQRSQNKSTRSFMDYEGVPAAVDGEATKHFPLVDAMCTGLARASPRVQWVQEFAHSLRVT